MNKLFSRDPEKVKVWEAFMEMEAQSNDSIEMELNMADEIEELAIKRKEPQPWVIEKLMLYLDDKNLELTEGMLTQSLKNEFMDLLE